MSTIQANTITNISGTTSYEVVNSFSFRNILINGMKTINQRNFDGISFVDGQYCWDRWKATATKMMQPVEDGNYLPNKIYTLSYVDGGTKIVTQITSAASGNWDTPEVPRTATEIQLELGTVATPYEIKNIGLELSLCQRYYARSIALLTSTSTYANISFPNTMRAIPTITTVFIGGSNTLVINYTGVDGFRTFSDASADYTYTADAEL